MILIDAIYINSFGGKEILELIIEKILKSNIKYYFIIDSRLKSRWLKKIQTNNYTLVYASHKNRKRFYKKNLNRFSSILCLSNIPPPIHTSIKTSIFFHNNLLLNPNISDISLKERLFNFLKLIYIKYYNQKDYKWIVQTALNKKLLQESINIVSNQISTYPIFRNELILNPTKKIKDNFVYISSGVPHKNHMRLIKAFDEVSKKIDRKIILNLTLKKEELNFKKESNNLKIKFYGNLSKEGVNKLYSFNDFAIYPSLVESFGLPLIEAANYKCKVIASDLPYVHEIIEPSLTFDPRSIKSISNSILKALKTSDLPETKILIDNQIDHLLEFIINQDVKL